MAATTLVMAGVSVCKLLPRRRTEAVLAGRPAQMASDRLALRLPRERIAIEAWAEVS